MDLTYWRLCQKYTNTVCNFLSLTLLQMELNINFFKNYIWTWLILNIWIYNIYIHVYINTLFHFPYVLVVCAASWVEIYFRIIYIYIYTGNLSRAILTCRKNICNWKISRICYLPVVLRPAWFLKMVRAESSHAHLMSVPI